MEDEKMEIKYRSIPGNTLLASNEKLLAECMELYSNHYGMWSKAGPHPGNHVKLSKERFLPWLQAESATLYYATLGEKVIGYAVAIRVKSKDFGTISWVTQLVVHSDYRNKGIAKNILFSIWCFSSDTAWGIVSSNPYAIRALEKATRRRAIPSRIKRNSKRLKNIGKEYVPYIDDDSEIWVFVYIFLYYVQIFHDIPQIVIFYPLNLLRQFIIPFGLLLPRIVHLIFVEMNVLLPFVSFVVNVIIYKCKINAINYFAMFSVLNFNSQNPC